MSLAEKKMKLTESSFLRACRGEYSEHTPIWLMRQAGRYLPEYRELRSKHSMMQMFTTPELAAEVSLQPIRRYAFDAAIIFADILTPLPAMGVTLDFVEQKGPIITNGVKSASDVKRLVVPKNVAGDFTLRAIELVRAELASSNTPLIGFAGGPFTLTTYLIESGLSEKGPATKKFMMTEPKAWHELQEKLVAMLVEYLVAQVEAGVSALQIFESWLGVVSPLQYREYVEPYLAQIISQVKKRVSVPVIFFSTGTAGLYQDFAKLEADVFGVDWRVNLARASAQLGISKALQGNLDPYTLLGDAAHWQSEVRAIINEGKSLSGHIFNLGHGILPQTSTEVVAEMVSLIRSL
jgi:uroporphyrinogen decarboxylase